MPKRTEPNAPTRDREPDRDRFFAMVGRCVTTEQTIEDHVEELFALALGGPSDRARAIIDVVLGLEKRLALVKAALKGSPHYGRWVDLSKRVREASEARNQIAHARPTMNHGATFILLDGDPTLPTTKGRLLHQEAPRMELRKRTRGGQDRVWTEESLREEHARLSKLFGHLVAFGMELEGKTPPAHLLAP